MKWKELTILFQLYRNDPDWKMGEPPPIDYCYVRPQHIPSVNMLCGQFFWPGIDCMYHSVCLCKYPTKHAYHN